MFSASLISLKTGSNSDRDWLSRIIFVSWIFISFVVSGPLLLLCRSLMLQLMVKGCTHDRILRVFFRLNCSSNWYWMELSKLTAILKVSFTAFLSLSDSWNAWIVICLVNFHCQIASLVHLSMCFWYQFLCILYYQYLQNFLLLEHNSTLILCILLLKNCLYTLLSCNQNNTIVLSDHP